ncbi:MAG: hypothetical protein ABI771_15645 [Betaproteobacteria bacterium]
MGKIPNVRLGDLLNRVFWEAILCSLVPKSRLKNVERQSDDRNQIDHGERQEQQQDDLKDEWQAGFPRDKWQLLRRAAISPTYARRMPPHRGTIPGAGGIYSRSNDGGVSFGQ